MMNAIECLEAYRKIEGWKVIADFSVGGFEWLGFSRETPNKMICISSQKTTLVDCENGEIEECDIVYDEKELFAICEKLPNEQIAIVGQYGGRLPTTSGKGEQIFIREDAEHIMKVTFISSQGKEIVIFWNYSAYICGFSYDGNYFVLADDGGITVIKRCK